MHCADFPRSHTHIYINININKCLWARLPPQILAFLGKDKFDVFNISAIQSVFWPNKQKVNLETQMNQEKGLGLQSQCPFFQKMLGTAVPGHFWAIFVKNVNREMGQICNISWLATFCYKTGEKRQKWQNLRRQTSPQPYKYICICIYI